MPLPEAKTETKPAPEPQTPPSPTSAKEILARASQVQAPAQPAPSDIPLDDVKSVVSLDDIKDPAARSLMEKRLKELESGFNKKYEQVANLRKELESKASQLNSPRQWTQEELDRALKDPSFISLVQARQQQAATHQAPSSWEGSADEWSALTPEEKQQFAHLNQRLSAQEQMMNQMQYEKLRSEEDAKLKESFPDYDPSVVDQIQKDLMEGRLQASREHLWKVANFDNAIMKAYELGKQDRKLDLNDKFNASQTLPVHNVTPAGEVPEDVRKQGFSAIGRWRLAQAKAGKK